MTVSLTNDVHAVGVNNSARQQVEVILLLADDNRMSSVVSALNRIPTSHFAHRSHPL